MKLFPYLRHLALCVLSRIQLKAHLMSIVVTILYDAKTLLGSNVNWIILAAKFCCAFERSEITKDIVTVHRKKAERSHSADEK